MIDIKEAREIHAAATEGEWSWNFHDFKTSDGRASPSIVNENGYGVLACDGVLNGPHSNDSIAIAHAHNIMPELLDELEAAKAEVDKWRRMMAVAEYQMSDDYGND